MAFQNCTLTADQRTLLIVTAQMVDALPTGSYSEKMLKEMIPDLSTSGLGPACNDQDFPPPSLDSPEFAQQVRRARQLVHGLTKISRMNRKVSVWSLAQNVGYATRKPICTGALVLGALMEGFTVSRSAFGVGLSRLNIATAAVDEFWRRVRA